MYLAIRRRISYTPSVEAYMVEQRANVAFLFLFYFDYVMLTYERYQALHVIHIRIPGEPGNEATHIPVLVRGRRKESLVHTVHTCAMLPW